MKKLDVNKIDQRVGGNVARLRIQAGMTKEGLGGRLEPAITQQAVSKYEKGLTRIPASTLVQIAAILRRPVADLFEGIAGVIDEDEKTDRARRSETLFKNFNEIPSAGVQTAIANLTKAMALELAGKKA